MAQTRQLIGPDKVLIAGFSLLHPQVADRADLAGRVAGPAGAAGLDQVGTLNNRAVRVEITSEARMQAVNAYSPQAVSTRPMPTPLATTT